MEARKIIKTNWIFNGSAGNLQSLTYHNASPWMELSVMRYDEAGGSSYYLSFRTHDQNIRNMLSSRPRISKLPHLLTNDYSNYYCINFNTQDADILWQLVEEFGNEISLVDVMPDIQKFLKQPCQMQVSNVCSAPTPIPRTLSAPAPVQYANNNHGGNNTLFTQNQAATQYKSSTSYWHGNTRRGGRHGGIGSGS